MQILLVSMALIAAVVGTLVIKVLDVADAVVVAPVHYSIIVVIGVYTLHREWRVKSGLPFTYRYTTARKFEGIFLN